MPAPLVENQGQLRPVAKRQQVLPFLLRKTAQGLLVFRAKPKCIQRSVGTAGHASQKSTRTATWIRRGSPTEKILPKNGPKSGFGPGIPMFGWFRALNASTRT